jgi:hypothetical protein
MEMFCQDSTDPNLIETYHEVVSLMDYGNEDNSSKKALKSDLDNSSIMNNDGQNSCENKEMNNDNHNMMGEAVAVVSNTKKLLDDVEAIHDFSKFNYFDCNQVSFKVWKEGVPLPISVNGGKRVYLKELNLNTSPLPPRLVCFSPIPFDPEVYFKLYAWIVYGIVLFGEKAYISRCQLYHEKYAYRYILCRVMVSMCNKPIRGYYIFDTDENSNPHARFLLLHGKNEISLSIVVFCYISITIKFTV